MLNVSDADLMADDSEPPLYCLFCDGTEIEECSECEGSGYIQIGEDASQVEACTECNCNGFISCRKCLKRESGYDG